MDGHVPAGKIYHLAAGIQVFLIEGGLLAQALLLTVD